MSPFIEPLVLPEPPHSDLGLVTICHYGSMNFFLLIKIPTIINVHEIFQRIYLLVFNNICSKE